MGLSAFQYVSPATLEEALSFLERHASEAKILAGGTDLLPSLKQGLLRPGFLVALQNVAALQGIEFTEQAGLRLGPMARLREVETNADVARHYPLLRQAANAVGSPQLRHMGTVGGNLALGTRCCYYNQSADWRKARETCLKVGGTTCHAVGGGKRCFAVFSGDVAPALLALRASVTVVSSAGTKVMPLRELYSGDGKNPLRLAGNEILSEIRVPPPLPGSWSIYHKYRTRKAIDFPLASLAAVFVVDSGGTVCRSARIAFSGISPAPLEVEGVAELLNGSAITASRIDEAAELAARQAKPVENLLGSSRSQRRWMIRSFVKKSVSQAVSALG